MCVYVYGVYYCVHEHVCMHAKCVYACVYVHAKCVFLCSCMCMHAHVQLISDVFLDCSSDILTKAGSLADPGVYRFNYSC